MVDNLLNFPDHKWKLLEEVSVNDRTIIAWYDPKTELSYIVLFNLESPSKKHPNTIYSTWGYPTALVENIASVGECAKLVHLYIEDIIKGNHWWES